MLSYLEEMKIQVRQESPTDQNHMGLTTNKRNWLSFMEKGYCTISKHKQERKRAIHVWAVEKRKYKTKARISSSLSRVTRYLSFICLVTERLPPNSHLTTNRTDSMLLADVYICMGWDSEISHVRVFRMFDSLWTKLQSKRGKEFLGIYGFCYWVADTYRREALDSWATRFFRLLKA